MGNHHPRSYLTEGPYLADETFWQEKRLKIQPMLPLIAQVFKKESLNGLFRLMPRRTPHLSDRSRQLTSSGQVFLGGACDQLPDEALREKVTLIKYGLRFSCAEVLATYYTNWKKCGYASWSHTDEWLALWVGRNKKITYGLDIEDPRRVTLDIIRRIAGPLELIPDGFGPVSLSLLWSAKEASFKALSRLSNRLQLLSQINVLSWQAVELQKSPRQDIQAFRFRACYAPEFDKNFSLSYSLEPHLTKQKGFWVRGIAISDSYFQIAVAEGC